MRVHAIVDDLGAVLVIAVFYTGELNGVSLLISLLVWGAALAYGRAHGERPLVFALLALAMWYFMLKSGIHSTIAGVLMAWTVPPCMLTTWRTKARPTPSPS